MKIFGSIEKLEKQEDGSIIVSGYASSEAQDCDGEIIKASAIEEAIPDYMKFANIREMHDSKKAAGVALEMNVLDDGKTFLKAHIIDSEAVKKVNAGVYKGFSIGGKVLKGGRDTENPKIIKGIRLSEISLVDRPANPESTFLLQKVEGGDKEIETLENEGGKVVEDAAKGEVAVAEKAAENPATDSTVTASTTSSSDSEPATKADGTTDDIKKGMYGIAWLADILTSINCLQSDAQWEADYEKDGSGLPAALKAWLVQGGELLKNMVAEEVAELTGADKEVIVDVIQLGEKAKNLMKAACSPEDAEKFAKGFDLLATKGDVIAKAGARNSSADQKHIDAIHAAAIALGAACDTAKAAGINDDIQKVAKSNDEIRKVLGITEGEDMLAKVNELVDMNNLFAKKITAFEAMPKPPKANVMAVEKSADAKLATEKEAVEEPKAANGKDALKKVWAGNPVFV